MSCVKNHPNTYSVAGVVVTVQVLELFFHETSSIPQPCADMMCAQTSLNPNFHLWSKFILLHPDGEFDFDARRFNLVCLDSDFDFDFDFVDNV